MEYEILIADKRTNGSIRNAINNDRIPAAWVVQEAEAFIYERLRVREMLTSTTGTLTTSGTAITLPARYRGWRDFRFTGTSVGHVRLKDPATVRAAYSYDSAGAFATGKPTMAYTFGTAAQFERGADQAYAWDLLYYQALPPLNSGTNSNTNVLTDRGLRMMHLACMAFANEWFKQDADKKHFLALAEGEIALMNAQGEMEQGGLDEAVYAA